MPMRLRKYTIEKLTPIVKASASWAQVLRACGLKPSGGSHRHIKNVVVEYRLDTSHFKGQGWSRGATVDTDSRVAAITRKISRPFSEMLVIDAPATINSTRLRVAFLSTGVNECCSKCGIKDWFDEPIKLHIDHINGVNNDNRIENLRFLCPNCHQQTPTWGKRKNGTGERNRTSTGSLPPDPKSGAAT